jgi:hypothetical protein
VVNDIGSLACILACRVLCLHMKYLGIPLGASYKAKSIWDNILDNMEHHLAS